MTPSPTYDALADTCKKVTSIGAMTRHMQTVLDSDLPDSQKSMLCATSFMFCAEHEIPRRINRSSNAWQLLGKESWMEKEVTRIFENLIGDSPTQGWATHQFWHTVFGRLLAVAQRRRDEVSLDNPITTPEGENLAIDHPDRGPTPERQINTKLTLERLLKNGDKITAKHYTGDIQKAMAFFLKSVRENRAVPSIEEASRAMNINENTYKTGVSRLRAALRKQISGDALDVMR
jgi:hypothetical protein